MAILFSSKANTAATKMLFNRHLARLEYKAGNNVSVSSVTTNPSGLAAEKWKKVQDNTEFVQ